MDISEISLGAILHKKVNLLFSNKNQINPNNNRKKNPELIAFKKERNEAIQMAKNLGYEPSEFFDLIDIANELNNIKKSQQNTQIIDDCLKSMMTICSIHNIKDIKALTTHQILLMCEGLDENMILNFAKNKSHVKLFSAQVNIDLKQLKDVSFNKFDCERYLNKAKENYKIIKHSSSKMINEMYNIEAKLEPTSPLYQKFINDFIENDIGKERYKQLTSKDENGNPMSGLSRCLTPYEAFSSLFGTDIISFTDCKNKEALNNQEIEQMIDIINKSTGKYPVDFALSIIKEYCF